MVEGGIGEGRGSASGWCLRNEGRRFLDKSSVNVLATPGKCLATR